MTHNLILLSFFSYKMTDWNPKNLRLSFFVQNVNTLCKEEKYNMATISKSVNRAFVLGGNKVSNFFQKKRNSSSDAINRFENRKNKVSETEKKGCYSC